MIHISINRTNRTRLNKQIISFYISIWYDRLVNLTKRKYTYNQVWRNIYNVLSFYSQTFNDNQVHASILNKWKDNGWSEIQYKNWRFAVIVQLDLFGNHIAIVQDCCHEKDYHNDTMETEPFKMDSENDKSHIVDWKEYKIKRIIKETVKQYLKDNLL